MPTTKLSPTQRLRANLYASGNRLRHSVIEGARVAENRMALLGALVVVAQPLFHLVFGVLFPQPHENGWLRLGMAILGLPLVVESRIPQRWRAYLPVYWLSYVTVTFPLFSTYMVLMNGLTAVALTYQTACVLLVFMLFDVRASLASVFVGCGLGVLMNLAFHHDEIPYHTVGPIAAVWLFAGTAAVLCDLSRVIAWRERSESIRSVTSTIAHELRTPLASIHLAARGLERHFPELLAGYDAAVTAGLIKPRMRARPLAVVRELASTVGLEAEHAQVTIEMLLAAAQVTNQPAMSLVDAGATVEAAVERYPYGSKVERERVTVLIAGNFTFLGWAPALTNVIFNLLKNAIHYTAKKPGASIIVKVDRKSATQGRILVWDNGPGISPGTVPLVFDRYVSGKGRPDTALGIGLAYCQDVVRKMNGDIECSSSEGVVTRFTILLPLLLLSPPEDDCRAA